MLEQPEIGFTVGVRSLLLELLGEEVPHQWVGIQRLGLVVAWR